MRRGFVRFELAGGDLAGGLAMLAGLVEIPFTAAAFSTMAWAWCLRPDAATVDA
jgi:hypothetical protein